MFCRSNWTKDEIKDVYHKPLLGLIREAAFIHQQHHPVNEVQVCSLISVKTGGCSEDCHYCPQAARYHTNVQASAFLDEESILQMAQKAIDNGATRICMGAAWRAVRNSAQFDTVLAAVKKIAHRGVEVCCTLGMLNEEQAQRLKEAGLYAYNHNLDSSPEFYSKIISTRTYEDRLRTLDLVEKAGISVCCGGIIGMGESVDDRIGLLHMLATRDPQPESVPINILIPVEGTPLEKSQPVAIWDMVRMVATARITMPKAMVRLSAGRLGRTLEEQALCFLAGANSIFSGERLLTRENPDFAQDREMFKLFGLTVQAAYSRKAENA